ncbi:putative eIF4-gamma/eIF5/eIF2b-epsilon carboxy-terminal domain protein [Toxoplasma gondii MAS]|uniref:Putative eIF4-gamma/eIF5/eIF2b-epsilon carboxy-terminal domain protein n=1 Tax=Toxoplasma gondii MAS TaxID=943118 RepID=A0A086R0E7_TOXGO|nr:putative eIF4-gamma/eIF5/eIF2b-epsilon carboxy-terminal domain protein [Toxoplasma gondii MAS]
MAPKKKGISVNLRDLQREMGVGVTLLPSAPKPVDEAALAAAEKERERERKLGPGGGRWADRMDDSDDDEWRRDGEGATFGPGGPGARSMEGMRREGGRMRQEVELPDEPWRRSAPLPSRDQEGGERIGRGRGVEEDADLGVLRSTAKANTPPAGGSGDLGRGGRGETAATRQQEEDLDFAEVRKATPQREGSFPGHRAPREDDEDLDFAAVRDRTRGGMGSGAESVAPSSDSRPEHLRSLRSRLKKVERENVSPENGASPSPPSSRPLESQSALESKPGRYVPPSKRSPAVGKDEKGSAARGTSGASAPVQNDRLAAFLEPDSPRKEPATAPRPAAGGASVTGAAPGACTPSSSSPGEREVSAAFSSPGEKDDLQASSPETAKAGGGARFVPKWKQRMEEERKKEEEERVARAAQASQQIQHPAASLAQAFSEENKPGAGPGQNASSSFSARVEEPVQVLQPVRLGTRKDAALGGSFVNGKYVPSGIRAQSQQSPSFPASAPRESEVQRLFKAAAGVSGSPAAGAGFTGEDEEELKRQEELQKKKEEKERRERERFEEQRRKREEQVKMLTHKEDEIVSLVQALEQGLDQVEKDPSKKLGVDDIVAVLKDEDELASIVPSAVVAAVVIKRSMGKENMEGVLEVVKSVQDVWKVLLDNSQVKDKDQVLIKEMVNMIKAIKCPRLSPCTAVIEAVWDSMVATGILSDSAFIRWFDDDNDDTEGRTEVLFQVLTWGQWLRGQLPGADAEEEEEEEQEEQDNDDYDIEALVPKREGEKSTKKKK